MSEPKPDKQYDATFQFGNTTVHVVAPQITEEERQRRLGEVQRIIWTIWNENHNA